MGRHSGVIILNAPYTVSYIHYTRLMAQRDNGLDNRDQSFKQFFPYSDLKYAIRETTIFDFFFVIKTTKRNNEERKEGRCSGTSNSGQNCWTTERYRDANHPLLALSLLPVLRYIVARAKNLPRFLKLRGYKRSLS